MTDFLKLGLRFLETVGLRGDKSLCSVRKKEGEGRRGGGRKGETINVIFKSLIIVLADFNKHFNPLNAADNWFADSPRFHKRPKTICKEMKCISISSALMLIKTGDNTNESYHKTLHISVISPFHWCAQ